MTTTKHWLGTAAIVLAIGTGSGAAFAQNQPETKHEEGRGAPAAPPHEMNRGETRGGAAGSVREQAESRESKPAAGQSAQQSTKGERDQSAQRDREQHEGREAKDASKDTVESKQKQNAAEERKNDNKNAADTNKAESNKAAQSGQQKQDREADRHDRNPANATQQSQDERKGRGSDQAADKQQGVDRNNSNQAVQSVRPNSTTTQQSSTQQSSQTDTNQRNTGGQPQNQADRGRSSTTVSVNDQQRTRVFDTLRRDREFDQARTDVDIRVNVGERLPERVRPRPLPTDIVTIVPEYRGYDYTVVHDEIAIIDPRSREIVDVIPQGGVSADRYGGGYGGTRVTLSDEQRQILFRSATTSTVGSTSSSSGSSGPTCLSLKRVPDELAKSNPELASYQYLAIGDQVVLVDPQNQKVVQVIDQQQPQPQ
jgi:Protein of unknown function (DUF1236)